MYISRYTPTILANMTAQQIEQASKSDQVIAIYYESPAVAPDEETNLQPASSTTATADSITEAFRVRDEKGLDGTGIKIGMIESGVPANDTEHFTTSNLFYDPIVCSEPNTVKTQYITPHASTVAYIMVGKSGGIVPNAAVYCTTVNARPGGWWEGIEWLMDQGVNIINISHSLADRQEARYNEYARWLDHVAIQHSVHIVIATGKTGSSTYMGPGAFGHNVISVGGTEADGTLGAYSNYSILYHKPDLCAPGTITSPYMSSYGTSFAAPQISAVLAQLCQRDSAVFTHQDMAKSILLASTVVTGIVSEPGPDSHTASQPGTGAGILNAWNAYSVLNNGRCRGTSFAANTGINATYTKTFSVSSKDSFVRVSLAWLADARISVADHAIADAKVTAEKLTLTVTAPDGTVWTSSAALSDMQLIAFVPNQPGVYTITVTRTSDLGTKIYFGISWY